MFTGGSRSYDAGRWDLREFQSWNPSITHPDEDISGTRDRIVARVRDLSRNNPVIAGAIDRRVETVVGPNIRMEATPNYEAMGRMPDWAYEWSSATEAKWASYTNDPRKLVDAERQSNFGGVVETAYRHYMVDGEACAIIKMLPRGGRYETCVQLIDPDRLSNPHGLSDGMVLTNGNRIFQGVEVDEQGAAVAYHIRCRHPNDLLSTDNFRWERVQRELGNGRPVFIHAYKRNRAEQRRGVSKLVSAIPLTHMAGKYDKAELEAALLNAVLAFSVESPLPNAEVGAALAPISDPSAPSSYQESMVKYREQNKLAIPGVTIRHTLPGEQIKVLQAEHPNGDYAAFQAVMLRKMAAAIGISYEQLSADWSSINYSSARTLLNEIWRGLLHDRYAFTQAFCTPIYAAWLEEAALLGEVKIPGGWLNFYKWRAELCQAEWMGPGRGAIDPLKEAQADDYSLNQGTTNEWLISDAMGQDYKRVIAGRARADKERAKWGYDAFVPLKAGAGQAGDAGATDQAPKNGSQQKGKQPVNSDGTET